MKWIFGGVLVVVVIAVFGMQLSIGDNKADILVVPTPTIEPYVDTNYYGEATYSPQEAERFIKYTTAQVIQQIKHQTFRLLSDYIHPEMGVQIYDVSLSTDQMFGAQEDQTVYEWNMPNAAGFRTDKTISDFFADNLYVKDFVKAPQILYNRFQGLQNNSNSILQEYGPSVIEVEYFFPGTWEYAEHDFEILHLTYKEHEGEWYLIDIRRQFWSP